MEKQLISEDGDTRDSVHVDRVETHLLESVDRRGEQSPSPPVKTTGLNMTGTNFVAIRDEAAAT